MYSFGNYENPIATVCHNMDDREDPDHRRVRIWVEDGYIVCQSSDEKEPHSPETPNGGDTTRALGTIIELWSHPDWDLTWEVNTPEKIYK